VQHSPNRRRVGKGWALARSFLKDPRRDGLPTDDFFEVGLHVYYRMHDQEMVVDAVEVFPPAAPTLDGFPLFAKPYWCVRDFMRTLDPGIELLVGGAKSLKLGVSLYGAKWASPMPGCLLAGSSGVPRGSRSRVYGVFGVHRDRRAMPGFEFPQAVASPEGVEPLGAPVKIAVSG
jgi:hypothetical protein